MRPLAGRGEVVRPSQAGDRVEQHDHVVTHLDQALGALDRQLGDGGVVDRLAVERRGDDLALHRALHVGDFLWTLVDQHDHEVALGVVRGDRVGDRLQHHRLACLGRRDDERALALADRHDQVDDARGEDVRLGLEAQPLLRVERGELGELDAVARLVWVLAVHRVQAHERVVLLAALAVAGLADRAGDRVAAPQVELANVGVGDVHVVRAGVVTLGADEPGVLVLDGVEDAGDRAPARRRQRPSARCRCR